MTDTNKTAIVSKPYAGAYRAELDKPEETEGENKAAADAANPDLPPDEQDNRSDEQLTPEERTYKKRYGDLRRFAEKKTQELKAEIENLKRAREHAEANGYRPPANKDELDAWVQKYPDVAKIVETIADKRASERAKQYETKISELETSAAVLRQEKALAQIEKTHPDFVSLKESDDFHDWAQAQPKHIQAWLYDNVDDATLVVRAVDLYKLDRGINKANTDTKRRKEMDAAAEAIRTGAKGGDPTKPQGKVWKVSEIAKLSTQQYLKYEAEIDEAVREGRVIQD